MKKVKPRGGEPNTNIHMESKKNQAMETNTNVEDEAYQYAIHVASSPILHMVLHAAHELDLFEIIDKATRLSGGTGADDYYVSPSVIASQLPIHNQHDRDEACRVLDRMLQLLASNSLLTCLLRTLEDGEVERCYGLSPAGRFFVRDEDGVSLALQSNLSGHQAIMDIKYHLKDAVLGGGVPFRKAHDGLSLFEYGDKNPEFGKLFNSAMTHFSTIVMRHILLNYKGFEGLKSLIDVGGGSGATLNMIISAHPSIVGINFDLPYTLTNAPSYPGIKHVGGDMFEEIPKGDVILLKWICHNWSDEHCSKILKNCYTALPENGKVIIIDPILPVAPTTTLIDQNITTCDNVMFAYFGGKERREKEFNALAKEAGFSIFQVVCCAGDNSIMELYK